MLELIFVLLGFFFNAVIIGVVGILNIYVNAKSDMDVKKRYRNIHRKAQPQNTVGSNVPKWLLRKKAVTTWTIT